DGRGCDEAYRGPDDRWNLYFFPAGTGGVSGNLRGVEMAFGKTAACLIVAAGLASAVEFPVRPQRLRKGCEGSMLVNETCTRVAGKESHTWSWKYEDIEELQLEPKKIRIVTYKDNPLRLGADRSYEFTGSLPVEELYRLWKVRMDQRFVAALSE